MTRLDQPPRIEERVKKGSNLYQAVRYLVSCPVVFRLKLVSSALVAVSEKSLWRQHFSNFKTLLTITLLLASFLAPLAVRNLRRHPALWGGLLDKLF